eukprot:4891215-Amphidinium_carterae.1
MNSLLSGFTAPNAKHFELLASRNSSSVFFILASLVGIGVSIRGVQIEPEKQLSCNQARPRTETVAVVETELAAIIMTGICY